MKVRNLITALVGAAALASYMYAAPVWTAVEGTTVTVTGTSTLHDWKVESKKIEGTVSVEPSFFETTSPAPTVKVQIPAKSLLSDKDKMNDLMWKALKADKHPTITYELTSAEKPAVTAKGFTVKTTGKLTIAGTTKPVNMTVDVIRDGNRMTVEGTLPITMSQYGMKPPTAMMGTIKTGDLVNVKFRWVTVQR